MLVHAAAFAPSPGGILCRTEARPMARVIYVDVDDTLVRSFGSKRMPMARSVELVRQLFQGGAQLYCWSSGGGDYARQSASELGLEDCFLAFLPKPDLLLDDVKLSAWNLEELHPNTATSHGSQRLLDDSWKDAALNE